MERICGLGRLEEELELTLLEGGNVSERWKEVNVSRFISIQGMLILYPGICAGGETSVIRRKE
jgi:hypothetical protein